MNWLSANYKWLFDGTASAAVIALLGFLLHRFIDSRTTMPAKANNGTALTASPSIDIEAKVDASPHIEQNVYVGTPPPAQLNQDAEPNELPTLRPMKPREVLLHQGPDGVWFEASRDLERARRAIILPFKNVPKQTGRRTPRAVDVSAGLVFKTPNGSEEMHVNHGTWLDRFEYSVTFNAGESHDLLVALKDVPFVTLDNRNSYNPLERGRFRSGTVIYPPLMRAVWKEGTVEVVLLDGSGVTLFHGIFQYGLSAEKMFLTPTKLDSGSKVHFVPDPYNNGWAGNDKRTDIKVAGTFTYEGERKLTVVDAYLKGTTPRGRMTPQVLSDSGLRPVAPVNSFELQAQVPLTLTLNLLAEPILADRGKSLKGQLVLRDNLNEEHEIDPADFLWIGQR